MSVHDVTLGRSVGDDDERGLPALIRESLGELKALTAEGRQPETASTQVLAR
jgi:hypothetical protein